MNWDVINVTVLCVYGKRIFTSDLFNVNVLDSVQIQAAFTQGILTLKNREITVTDNSN